MSYMKILLFIALSISHFGYSQDLIPFKIYDKKGKEIKYKKILKELTGSDVILFGELHNNPISHWIQLKLSEDLNSNYTLALGAEMLERDNQEPLSDYLNGKIDQDGLDTLARLWPNYRTDYKPLVDFAKNNEIEFIATNIPRRYASMVYKNGFSILDTLSEKEKSWIADLPIPYDPELPGYKKMLTMMSDHANENFPKAQAIKDATMAESIVNFLEKNKVEKFLHFHGAFHSNNFEGIFWYLEQYNPALSTMTLTTVLQENVNILEDENKELADFIIVVDEKMTTTH